MNDSMAYNLKCVKLKTKLHFSSRLWKTSFLCGGFWISVFDHIHHWWLDVSETFDYFYFCFGCFFQMSLSSVLQEGTLVKQVKFFRLHGRSKFWWIGLYSEKDKNIFVHVTMWSALLKTSIIIFHQSEGTLIFLFYFL